MRFILLKLMLLSGLLLAGVTGCRGFGSDDRFSPDWTGNYEGYYNQEKTEVQIQLLAPDTIDLILHSNTFKDRWALILKNGSLVIKKPGIEFDLSKEKASNCWVQKRDSLRIELCTQREFSFIVFDTKTEKEVDRLILKRTNTYDQPAYPRSYKLQELKQLAFQRSFSFREELQIGQQNKLQVKNTLGNLIPHLGINSYAGFVLFKEVLGSLGLFSDLIPFVWPNRWYELEATKEEARAQQNAIQIVQWNSRLDAELLSLAWIMNQRLLVTLENEEQEISRISTSLEGYAKAGLADPQAGLVLAANLTKVKLAKQDISLVQKDTLPMVAWSAGFYNALSLSSIEFSEDDFAEIRNIKLEDRNGLIQAALSRSLEIQQLEQLKRAAEERTQGRYWNFLDPDGEPKGNLGFGFGAYIAIGRSQQDLIQRRIERLKVEIPSQLGILLEKHVGLRKRYAVALEGLKQQKFRVTKLMNYLNSGMRISLLEIADAFNARTDLNNEVIATEFALKTLEAKIIRMTYQP